LFVAIVLHPHKSLLHPLPGSWWSLFAKFVLYMNCTFLVYTEPAMSLWGIRTRTRSNQWNLPSEHAFSCLGDDLKHSVNELEHLEEGKQIDSKLNSSQNDVTE
jgi:hypothetical protein